MKLIIDIPKEKYDWIMSHLTLDRNFRECKITPFPKGHGRLIDADTLYREIETEGWFDSDDEYYGGGLEDIVLNAPTIIEADKENKQ